MTKLSKKKAVAKSPTSQHSAPFNFPVVPFSVCFALLLAVIAGLLLGKQQDTGQLSSSNPSEKFTERKADRVDGGDGVPMMFLKVNITTHMKL
jgi:hypothetical protein